MHIVTYGNSNTATCSCGKEFHGALAEDLDRAVAEHAALDDAKELLEEALAGPAGEDDWTVAPLRRIITALETERCDFDCDACRWDGDDNQ